MQSGENKQTNKKKQTKNKWKELPVVHGSYIIMRISNLCQLLVIQIMFHF